MIKAKSRLYFISYMYLANDIRRDFEVKNRNIMRHSLHKFIKSSITVRNIILSIIKNNDN